MELEGYSQPSWNKLCAFSHDALDRRIIGVIHSSTSFVDHTNTPSTRIYRGSLALRSKNTSNYLQWPKNLQGLL